MVSDSLGNIVISGAFRWDMDLCGDSTGCGGTYNVEDRGGFIAKFSAEGKFVWSHLLDEGALIAMDSNDNVYAASDCEGAIHIDGETIPETIGCNDWLAKLSPAGEVLWAKQFFASDQVDLSGVGTDAQDNLYFLRSTYAPYQPHAEFTKMTSEGDVIWTLDWTGVRAVGGPVHPSGLSVIQLAVIDPTFAIDEQELGVPGENPTAIVKINAAGEVLWSANITCDAAPWGMGFTPDGSAIVGGWELGHVGLGNTVVEGTSDLFLMSIGP